ncbi:MAG: hydratase [Frankiales bacterium]|nr:hydratase [Frankiales bacterium]
MEHVAATIDAAHLRAAELDADGLPVGDLATAYRVQAALTRRRTARGSHRIGWKLGYTSQAMRAQMGIDRPNHGPLLSDMVIGDGDTLPAGLIHPRVEPEIALRLARTPPAGAGPEEVLAACASAHAALEVVDSAWRDYRFDVEHNTADGSSAAGVVLGPQLPLSRLDEVAVTLEVDGRAVASGRGADAAGHPAAALAWLVGALAEAGETLRPDDVVITGGLTAAHPVGPGGAVSATFAHPDGARVQVTVRR